MLHLLCGRRHVGKTTLADYLAAKTTRRLRFSPRNSLQAYPGDDYVTSGLSASAILQRPSWRSLTVVPDIHVDDAFEHTMRAFKAWYQTMEPALLETGESVSVFVDEARFGGVKDSESFDWVLRCTDRSTVHVILTMHRPKDVLPDIRAIVDYWYVLYIVHPRDLETLTDECGDAVATLAPKLKEREFIKYDVNAPPGVRAWTKRDDAATWAPTNHTARRVLPSNLLGDDVSSDVDDFELTDP